jgi:hypothetical protein
MREYLLEMSFAFPDTGEATAVGEASDAVRPLVSRFGGSLERSWLSKGERNLVTVIAFPEAVNEPDLIAAFTAHDAISYVVSRPLYGTVCIHGFASVTGDCDHP